MNTVVVRLCMFATIALVSAERALQVLAGRGVSKNPRWISASAVCDFSARHDKTSTIETLRTSSLKGPNVSM